MQPFQIAHWTTDPTLNDFCDECQRVYAYWKILKCLFDDNADVACLKAQHYEHFFYTMKCALYDACTQGIVRLHDPSTQMGRKNLSVNYVVEELQWDTKRKTELEALRSKMAPFIKKLKLARNRFIAHNDLDTLLKKAPFGQFKLGKDQEYFCNLEKFASIALGEEFIFPYSLIENDVSFFMAAFKRGMVPLK